MSYGYDSFGNMLTRERTDELFAVAACFELDLGLGPMMRNRVATSSMSDYDAGGRMTRVRDNAGAMMSLLWEAMELVPDGESPGATSRMKYTGHERDESAGMDYMLARYLPISSARLMSRDSSRRSEKPRDPQSWDRFTYVRNRPLLSIDPTGLSDTDALQAMRALDDLEVIVGLHEALREARGTGMPEDSREAVGGIAELATEDGRPAGEYVAVHTFRENATSHRGGRPLTAREIVERTGGRAVAGFHTHQLVGVPGVSASKRQSDRPTRPDDTEGALRATGYLPHLTVSARGAWLAWRRDDGSVGVQKVLDSKFKVIPLELGK